MRDPGLRLLPAALAVLVLCQGGGAGADGEDDATQFGREADDKYQLISSSKPTDAPAPEDAVASSDLPAADKQYEYPLMRPVYAPFVTRPSVSSWPYVEIVDHHRNPPFVTPKPNYLGNPMVSTVVVQDMSQTASPKPPLSLHHGGSLVEDFNHLGPTKIPFTDVQVMTKPIREKPSASEDENGPNFTDKFEETSLENSESSEDSQSSELIENPPNLDMSGIVQDVLNTVFSEKQVLADTGDMIPQPEAGVKTWPCPPKTCCSKSKYGAARKCSTFVSCVSGCPLRAERLPEALALTKPSNGHTNPTDAEPDVRDGEPRGKKKKILKKKKKLLKKFLLPLLLAYKLLFMLIVPLLVNGMMMMMSSSGMAGFFFALIGASITMVRVYSNPPAATPTPPPKVVKVIKYVQPPPSAPPSTTPAPTPAPTIIHHQPYVEEHHPTYHAPPYHPPPSYGSYYPPPYWTRNYDRAENHLDGGRKKRRRKDNLDDMNEIYLTTAENGLWILRR